MTKTIKLTASEAALKKRMPSSGAQLRTDLQTDLQTDLRTQLGTQLGNMPAEKFLQEYWQKKPLLIRNAFPHFDAPLTIKEILTLAKRDEAWSRLITRRGAGKDALWELQEGPLKAKDFRAAADSIWTVLVQDTQHFSHEAHQLLRYFNFIHNARIDDLMVSYAVKGGGVGPHFDSYDVFLLQGEGQRRWQVSSQTDLRLKPGMPLKILSHFKAENDWVLDAGDMLYLPPGFAHHGVAETDDCVTWSVGFRAPSQQEIAAAFLDYLRDEIDDEIEWGGQYRDGDLCATTTPGVIGADMVQRISTMLSPVRAMATDQHALKHFLGCYLTEPKSHVYFDPPGDPPEAPLTLRAFAKAASASGLVLDLKTRLLYDDSCVFLNGEALQNLGDSMAAWRMLADERAITFALNTPTAPTTLTASATAQDNSFYKAYLDGYLHIA